MSGKAGTLTIENKSGGIVLPARAQNQQYLVHRSTIPCLVRNPYSFVLFTEIITVRFRQINSGISYGS